MTHLAKHEIEQVRLKLRELRQALLDEVRKECNERENQHLASVMGNDPGDSGDVSLADALADLNIARMDRQVRELRGIEAKLVQLRQDDINECADCGGSIGFQRLLVNPAAMRCVSCQQKHEQTHSPEAHPAL